MPLQIMNVNLRQRKAILTDGQLVEISKFLDHDGDETDDLEEAVAMVAGPDQCGKWYADSVDSFFPVSRPN